MTDKIVSLSPDQRPSREEAEAAVRTLLEFIGENPDRDGLLETPARVVKSYEEFFAGYDMDAAKELSKTFKDIEDFDEMVIVKGIDFVSHCEHHMVTITGKAHVAYWPSDKVVGISKLARVVDVFAKRLVSQENMTRFVLNAIDDALAPKGTAVMIEADHHCMSIRGVNKAASSTVTSLFSGIFKEDQSTRERFLKLIEK